MKKIFLNLITCIFAFILIANTANAAMFEPSKKKLKEYLTEHSLVIVKDKKPVFYEGENLEPLINAIKDGSLNDAYVSDRKIGKAAALLITYGRAKKVYTPVISKPAIEVFKNNNINYKADETVENIMNMEGTDICPLEERVRYIDGPYEAYRLIQGL